MKPAFSDTGIILRSVDFGEADRLVSILTHGHGYLDFIAKGARRLNSKKAPHLDIFNKVKFQIGRGYSPQLLIQAETVEFYPSIKSSLEKTRLVMTFGEILNSILPKEEEDRESYLSFSNYIKAIETGSNISGLEKITLEYSQYVLRHLGYPLPKILDLASLQSYFETVINKRIISRDLK